MRRSPKFVRVILSVLIVLGPGVSLANGSSLSPGDILVADQGTGTIHHYSAIGTDLGAFASGLASPSWIAADTSGNVYVSEYGGNSVRKFSPSGATLLAITTAYTPGGVAIEVVERVGDRIILRGGGNSRIISIRDNDLSQ